MNAARDQGLVELWVPLLNDLTERFPRWGLWKNSEAALSGHGDFDSTAPREDWDGITATFRDRMLECSFGPVAACRHVTGVLFLVSLDRERGTVLELDVNAKKYFRGWTMFEPADLTPVMEIDELGFRRVRPGAEGLILLVQNGTRWGGRPNEEGLEEKAVASFLEADPEGVHLASKMFGPAQGLAERAAKAAAQGKWDRSSMLALEVSSVIRAFGSPGVLGGRFLQRRRKRQCPLLRTIFFDGRSVPDPDRWVAAVSQDHDVYGDV